MDQHITKIKQEYTDEIKVIESNIKDIASGTAPKELNSYTQDKLDKLAKRFQYNEQLGKATYKLYELQALLYYYQNQDDYALDFINQAIETKGATYSRAEKLIEQLQSGPSSVAHNNEYDSNELPLELQALIKGMRNGAIIMAVLSVLSIYFIPWAVFYIILATKLKQDVVPNRKLVKWSAIVTLPLCTALIPIFIDVEFWRMNRRLKEYEEQGPKAFKSDEEFLEGEPKQKRRNRIAWIILLSIIAIFVVLIVVAIASSSTDSSTTNTSNTRSSGSSNSQVDSAYNKMESLRSQHTACSNDLESRRDSVDIYSDYEVDTFNSDLEDCEDTRLKLNSAVVEYNRIAGYE